MKEIKQSLLSVISFLCEKSHINGKPSLSLGRVMLFIMFLVAVIYYWCPGVKNSENTLSKVTPVTAYTTNSAITVTPGAITATPTTTKTPNASQQPSQDFISNFLARDNIPPSMYLLMYFLLIYITGTKGIELCRAIFALKCLGPDTRPEVTKLLTDIIKPEEPPQKSIDKLKIIDSGISHLPDDKKNALKELVNKEFRIDELFYRLAIAGLTFDEIVSVFKNIKQ